MGLIAALAGGLALFTQSDPVDLALMLPDKPVIETRIESSEREDDGEWSTSTSAYRIEVRPDGESSYRTSWQDLDDPGGVEMIIITDEALIPMRIENLGELFDGISKALATEGGPAEDNAAAVDFLRALPPETVTALLLKDAIMVAFGQGSYLIPGERNDYRQAGAAFGDSGSMTMNASFLLESVKQDRAVVLWVSEIDPADARKALPGLIRDMFNLLDEEVVAADKMAAFLADASLTVRTECRYDIAIATGLAERIDCSRLQDLAIGGESRRKESRLTATQRLLN